MSLVTWSLPRPDRRAFNTVDITISVGTCTPSGSYRVEYYDIDQEDFVSDTIAENSSATITASTDYGIELSSLNQTEDQAWQVGTDAITGRGNKISFDAPSANASFEVARSEVSEVVANTLSNLTGGMEGYTYTDFVIE